MYISPRLCLTLNVKIPLAAVKSHEIMIEEEYLLKYLFNNTYAVRQRSDLNWGGGLGASLRNGALDTLSRPFFLQN